MTRLLILALLFVTALDADAAFRRYPAPAPAKKAAKETQQTQETAQPWWIPSTRTASKKGLTLELPQGVVKFASREDAQAFGALLAKDLEKAQTFRDNTVARGVAKVVETPLEVVVADLGAADLHSVHTVAELNADAPWVKAADGSGLQFYISMLDYDVRRADLKEPEQTADKAKKKKKKH